MKSLLFIAFAIISFIAVAQPLDANWSSTGKFKDIQPGDVNVIRNYADTRTEYFQHVADKQKTALLRLANEILKEDPPQGINFGGIFLEVGLKTFAGYIDNIKEDALRHIPVASAIIEMGMGIYKQYSENSAQIAKIKNKNSLLDAINRLAENIDAWNSKTFSATTMDIIANDFLPLNLTSAGTDYLLRLEDATTKYTLSVPTADEIYIRTIENLLNELNRQNADHGVIRLASDYQNFDRIENLSESNFELAPYNVTIRINNGPYRSKIMKILNTLIDQGSIASVLKLRVHKIVICHFKTKAGYCTIETAKIKPDFTVEPTYHPGNPYLQFVPYIYSDDGFDVANTYLKLKDYKLRYDDVNNYGTPAKTTYSMLFTAAYNNVWSNASKYKKFNP